MIEIDGLTKTYDQTTSDERLGSITSIPLLELRR